MVDADISPTGACVKPGERLARVAGQVPFPAEHSANTSRGEGCISAEPKEGSLHRSSFRTFCRVCGSLAPGQAPYLTTMSIPAGLLDGDPGVRPRLHVFTSSKAPWWEITDNLPQHPKWVPGYEPKQT